MLLESDSWFWNLNAPEFQPSCTQSQTNETCNNNSTSSSWNDFYVENLRFEPNYVSFIQKNLLCLGGTGGTLALLYNLGSTANEKYVAIPVSFSDFATHTEESLFWLHVRCVSPTCILAVSQHRVFLAQFSDTPTVGTQRDCITIGVPKNPDDYVTSVGSFSRDVYTFGTDQGHLYSMNIETGAILNAIQLKGTAVSPYNSLSCSIMESENLGSSPDFNHSFQHYQQPTYDSPVTGANTTLFGTQLGQVLILDYRLPAPNTTIRVMDMPMFGISQQGWEVLALGSGVANDQSMVHYNMYTRKFNWNHWCPRWDTQLIKNKNEITTTCLCAVDLRMLNSTQIIWDKCDNNIIDSFQNKHHLGYDLLQHNDKTTSNGILLSEKSSCPPLIINKHPVLRHCWLGLDSQGDILTFGIEQTVAKAYQKRGLLLKELGGHKTLWKLNRSLALSQEYAVFLDVTGTLKVAELLPKKHSMPVIEFGEFRPATNETLEGSRFSNYVTVHQATNNQPSSQYYDHSFDNNKVSFHHLPEYKNNYSLSENNLQRLIFVEESDSETPQLPLPVSVSNDALTQPTSPWVTDVEINHKSQNLSFTDSHKRSLSKIKSEPDKTMSMSKNKSLLSKRQFNINNVAFFLKMEHLEYIRSVVMTPGDTEHIRLSRPPPQLRWIPTSVALESITLLRQACQSSQIVEVEIDLIELACWQRDTKIVGKSLSTVLTPEIGSFLDFSYQRRCKLLRNAENSREDADVPNEKLQETFAEAVVASSSSWSCHITISDLKTLMYRPEATLSLYNLAGPSGLEPSRLCPMVNAVVQVLRFVPGLGKEVLQHYCEKPSCLACELGLLWHMHELAQMNVRKNACQAKNLLYAFSTIPEVRLCKILPERNDDTADPEVCLDKSAVVFFGFLLQHLRREFIGGGDHNTLSSNSKKCSTNFIDNLFGCQTCTLATCLPGNHKQLSDSVMKYVIDLNEYSITSTENQFLVSLRTSLEKTFTRSVFCSDCKLKVKKEYQQKVKKLPPVLALNCRSFFTKQRQRNLSNKLSSEGNKNNITSYNETLANQNLPYHFWVGKQSADGPLEIVTNVESCSPALLSSKLKRFELLATIFLVREPLTLETATDDKPRPNVINTFSPDHLVAHIRVPTSGLHHKTENLKFNKSVKLNNLTNQFETEKDSLSSDYLGSWVAMNDYIVTPASVQEVLSTNDPWKHLSCVLYYCKSAVKKPVNNNNSTTTSIESKTNCRPCSSFCPIPPELVAKNVNLALHRLAPRTPPFEPLTTQELQEIMNHGNLFSLDAEFVKARLVPDLREDTLALARVSIIRGKGPKEGVPCLDCHVQAFEEPIDYLTEFSGLNEGDLDINRSQKWLTSRKTLYQKLRFLVDYQCIFLGHGLSKDFSIINLFVPDSQLIDTAELFRLPGRRYLSLKFLAKHVLFKNIQSTGFGHDSVEDASIALQLYKRYLELKQDNELPSVLQNLYSIGRLTNWDINFSEQPTPFLTDMELPARTFF